jgi:hypothetical protein
MMCEGCAGAVRRILQKIEGEYLNCFEWVSIHDGLKEYLVNPKVSLYCRPYKGGRSSMARWSDSLTWIKNLWFIEKMEHSYFYASVDP